MKINKADSRKDRKTIWVYAATLFSIAFMILLLTAYSQVKLQNNKSEYENQISSEQKEKENVISNLNSVVEENKKLKVSLDEAKKNIDSLGKSKESSDAKSKALEEENRSRTAAYDNLMLAAQKYINGDITECAILLYNLKSTNYLSKEAFETYTALVNKSYKTAAFSLYRDGYTQYMKKDYEKAQDLFQKSINLSENEYFSDDCYYLKGYCQIYLGKKDEAKATFTKILNTYPTSTYKKEVTDLLLNL